MGYPDKTYDGASETFFINFGPFGPFTILNPFLSFAFPFLILIFTPFLSAGRARVDEIVGRGGDNDNIVEKRFLSNAMLMKVFDILHMVL